MPAAEPQPGALVRTPRRRVENTGYAPSDGEPRLLQHTPDTRS